MALVSWTKVKLQYYKDKRDLKKKGVVRAAAILTDTYVATHEVDVKGFSKAAIFFKLTAGSLTSFEYEVQHSPDEGTTWYDLGVETVTLTTVTDGQPDYSTPATTKNWTKIFFAPGELFRLRVKGTGTATGSSLAVTIMGLY